ncbi:MAG TPA: hypothetical protein VK506_13790, partial [Conexibacter sp.]|nr:hypothetical protein [Conexibacter sp.]
PSSDARQALTLRAEAERLVVVDKSSHTAALLFIKDAKTIKRNITEHWQRITRAVDEMKTNLLNLKRQDLEPVERAIALVEDRALAYQREEDRRVREEEDRRRRDAEREANERRERELAEQERKALEHEAQSADLSEREELFVTHIVLGDSALVAARQARFKDPAAAASRLMKTAKILAAISGRQRARELRQQAEAIKAQPLDVVTAKPVERQVGKVSGTRTVVTYSAVVDDADKLIDAVCKGDAARSVVMPNVVELNAQARQLKDAGLFAAAFPGCRLVKHEGIAG